MQNTFQESVYRALPQMLIDANINPKQLQELYAKAQRDPLSYWENAAEELGWYRKWDAVLDDSKAPFYKWFSGARCNITYNAIERHLLTGSKNRLALIWQGEAGEEQKLSYYELHREVNKAANGLRLLGIKKNDSIMLLLPSLIEAVILLLATIKIGAIACPIDPLLPDTSILKHIIAFEPKLLVTVDGFYNGGQIHLVKQKIDTILEKNNLQITTLLIKRTNIPLVQKEWDVEYNVLIHKASKQCATEVMDSNDPFLLYPTKDEDGNLYGIMHAHGGFMVSVQKVFLQIYDLKKTDIFWNSSPFYSMDFIRSFFAAILTGTTFMLYEGHSCYPQADRFWKIIEKYGITIFATNAEQLRELMGYGSQFPQKADLATLRILALEGTNISPTLWNWYYQYIGSKVCPVIQTWAQAEMATPALSPLPISLLQPSSVAKPLPGITLGLQSSNSCSSSSGKEQIVLLKPYPGLFSAIYNNKNYYKKYWQDNIYLSDECAEKDDNGYFYIADNENWFTFSQKRIAKKEIENVLQKYKPIKKVAVHKKYEPVLGSTLNIAITLQKGTITIDTLAVKIEKYLARHIDKNIKIGKVFFE